MNEQFYIHAPWNVCPRMTFTVIDFYLSLIYDNNSSFIQLYIRVCIFVNVHLIKSRLHIEKNPSVQDINIFK